MLVGSKKLRQTGVQRCVIQRRQSKRWTCGIIEVTLLAERNLSCVFVVEKAAKAGALAVFNPGLMLEHVLPDLGRLAVPRLLSGFLPRGEVSLSRSNACLQVGAPGASVETS